MGSAGKYMFHKYLRSHLGKIVFIAMAVVLSFTGLRVLLWPPLASLYFQVQGGKLLASTLRTYQVDQALSCSFNMSTNSEAQEALTDAVRLLNQAVQTNPSNAQAYLLLGRSLCAGGDEQNAIGAYQEYTRLRPQNPLGHVELALAINATGDRSLAPMLLDAWKAANIDPGLFLESARTAFIQHRYADAAQDYQHAWFVEDGFTPVTQFQWAISAVIAEQTMPSPIPEETAPIYQITQGQVKIDGSKLQWMRDHPSGSPNYGEPLEVHPITPNNIGVMWWGGQAVAFIEIDQEGSYEFTIQAQHTLPVPIQAQLEINFEPILPFELDRGDLSWEQFSTTVYLTKGIYLFGVNYLNNAAVNGSDRDLHVEWIELKLK